MRWPWAKPATPSYRALRAQLIEQLNPEEEHHDSREEKPLMSDRIWDRFTRSPIARKLEAEQREEDLAQRREWAADRARLRTAFERQRPPRLEALVAAEARERALEAELRLTREARTAAARAVTAASLQFDAADGVLIRQLRTPLHPKDRQGREVPCDPDEFDTACGLCRIRAVRHRLLGRLDAARAAAQTTGPQPGPMNPVTMRAQEFWGSNCAENVPVIEAAVAACRQLEALELEVLEEAELSRRLIAIAASVPAPTESVPTQQRPAMTPAEERALTSRLAAQEANR
jgi:hypothetical protein